MAKFNISSKRLQIDKTNARIVGTIAGAAAIFVFSLVASKALLSQRSYQNRVIDGKEQAVKQLKDNVAAVENLVTSYTAFVNAPDNVLGGNPKGSGDKDGDNAKIVLDALPSKYDFPALATSLEKLLGSYKINAITGTDDEVNQQNTASPSPVPVEMPFEITVTGTYGSMKDLVATLERSIRPIQVQTIELSGNDADLKAVISAKTFYQPEKDLNNTTREIR